MVTKDNDIHGNSDGMYRKNNWTNLICGREGMAWHQLRTKREAVG